MKQGHRALLEWRLAETRNALERFSDVTIEEMDETTTNKTHEVSVVVGNSKLMEQHEGLDKRLTEMIHRSYNAVEGTGPRMLEHMPVSERLKMGDGGPGFRANRALHVALLDGKPVGCISSSFQTPWTQPGVGHWGLLVVDLDAQGKGIGSALVASAERRLAEECNEIHMEYDFIVGKAHSKRLRDWYEKCGYPRGGANPNPSDEIKKAPAGSEFCWCRKLITKEKQLQGQKRRLLDVQKETLAELAKVDASTSEEDGGFMKAQVMFDRLSSFVAVNGSDTVKMLNSIFQLIVTDAGPEGKFVMDLKNGTGSTWIGEDPNADCTMLMTDDDMLAMFEGRLDGMYAFWNGRLKIKGNGMLMSGLGFIMGEAKKL